MIKVIAFDLVGVLVNEKDINLSLEEEKLERLFGDNISDSDYLIEGRKIISNDSILMRVTKNLIAKLYKVKDKDLFKKIKTNYSNVKLVIATNHVSFVRKFIVDNFDIDYLDDILISAEIHKIKPNSDFYEYMLNKYGIKPKEMLFLDDNINNLEGANKLGINVIKVDKKTNLYDDIISFILSNN